ncbi:enoyl-CoA hydratase-related protein [Mangrovihabitans endophyticus]|uniref:Formyl transferase C-terminal domain-containing protein n=1 Tax=Mangrovihabitans endophyticus TaxID=1751298 RepID=A0A8J3C0H1_9ACTN|nr:enoyl-CoA hydratase-related protein [Mangrovihabitans endophyticus]GGK91820.1 hypothetical protein GCM10012284_27180 [Mangrovihabitans endophyticus]
MRILLLVSAFDGLSQRAWCALRDAGHDVGVHLADGAPDLLDGVRAAAPDLVFCLFPSDATLHAMRRDRRQWRHWRTVVLRPAPVGDHGPAPVDRAIVDGLPSWGVTALQLTDDPDTARIWTTRTFAMPAAAPRKTALMHGPVADAAMACLKDVIGKAADPSFSGVHTDQMPTAAPGQTARPAVTPHDRALDWAMPTEQILRRVRAADGNPGVRAELAGLNVLAYDAHPGPARGGRPGSLLMRRQGAVLVATGDGSAWLGHLRADAPQACKLPATTLLGKRLHDVPHSPVPPGCEPETPSAYRQVRYRRSGGVGWLVFDFYNGAMSTGHCRRLLAGLRHATAQDTDVLVLRGGTDAFSNGLHLHVIEAAAEPASAAWHNIRAFNAICKEIIGCTRQLIIAAYAGSAAAGGAMLGLGADVTAARAGIVLNPHYGFGLYGSDLHTWTLPRRVGADTAQRLIDEKLPVSVERAASAGFIDEVGPRHPGEFTEWLTTLAGAHADPRASRARRSAKARRLAAERIPVDAYEARELAEMSRDTFGDRSGFAAARHAFVHRTGPAPLPARLRMPARGPDPTQAGSVPPGPIPTPPGPIPVSAGPIPVSAGPIPVSAGPIPTPPGPIQTPAGPIPTLAGPVSAGPVPAAVGQAGYPVSSAVPAAPVVAGPGTVVPPHPSPSVPHRPVNTGPVPSPHSSGNGSASPRRTTHEPSGHRPWPPEPEGHQPGPSHQEPHRSGGPNQGPGRPDRPEQGGPGPGLRPAVPTSA